MFSVFIVVIVLAPVSIAAGTIAITKPEPTPRVPPPSGIPRFAARTLVALVFLAETFALLLTTRKQMTLSALFQYNDLLTTSLNRVATSSPRGNHP